MLRCLKKHVFGMTLYYIHTDIYKFHTMEEMHILHKNVERARTYLFNPAIEKHRRLPKLSSKMATSAQFNKIIPKTLRFALKSKG